MTNNIKVNSGGISLGSTLEANGQVTAAGKPLGNASMALYVGDVLIAHTQTDQSGRHAFAVPVGLYYFPAVFSNGATIYTVTEPSIGSLPSAPSAVTPVSVDLLPFSLIIAAVTVAILIGLYLFVWRMRGKAVHPLRGRRRVKPGE